MAAIYKILSCIFTGIALAQACFPHWRSCAVAFILAWMFDFLYRDLREAK